MRRLSAAQSDRAAGALWGQACGDALGAGYEFGPSLPSTYEVRMKGGGLGWAPGEWTDDTQMSVPLLEAAEAAIGSGSSLLDHLDDVANAWIGWAPTANDVGTQTRAVLSAARSQGSVTADSLAEIATHLHERTGRTAGNGSLMRTAPVALALLGDDDAIAAAARRVSSLTHADLEAGDACVLWCLAISRAVLRGELDLRAGLAHLPEERRSVWEARIDEAEAAAPADFPRNGWVVHAFQAAWSAISTTPVPHDPADHFRLALENAVRAGHDTDTVAAIAGQLLGARWGASAVPWEWRRVVHGWPGMRGHQLATRGLAVARGGGDPQRWPYAARLDYSGYGARGRLVEHPGDPGVLLGDAAWLDALPSGVDAVVSLCRLGSAPLTGVRPEDHVQVWLVDSSDPAVNPHLDHVLVDAADAVAGLRAEGRTVLLHCVAAQSRTPTVAAVYALRHLGADPDTALDAMCAALPDPRPNSAFVEAVRRARPGQ